MKNPKKRGLAALLLPAPGEVADDAGDALPLFSYRLLFLLAMGQPEALQ